MQSTSSEKEESKTSKKKKKRTHTHTHTHHKALLCNFAELPKHARPEFELMLSENLCVPGQYPYA